MAIIDSNYILGSCVSYGDGAYGSRNKLGYGRVIAIQEGGHGDIWLIISPSGEEPIVSKKITDCALLKTKDDPMRPLGPNAGLQKCLKN